MQKSFHRLGDGVIIIGQNGVDAHGQEFLSLLGIIRPEHIAPNAIFVSPIDHGLVEAGLNQLHFFAAQGDRPLHDLPGGIATTAAPADAEDCL